MKQFRTFRGFWGAISLVCLMLFGISLLKSEDAHARRRRCRNCFTSTNLQNLGARRGVNNSQFVNSFRNGPVSSQVSSQLKEIQGFSNLLTDGRVLFERTLVPQGPIRVEVVRQLFIGPAGELLNSVDPLTRVQVKDLFLKNFQKFKNANDKRNAARFLAANGAQDAFLGNLRVAIKGGLLPPGVKLSGPKYANYDPDVVNAAALAYAINMVSNARNPISIRKQNMFADGTIRMNLAGALDAAGLARLLNDNPYDCEKRGVARADWLVSRILDPDIYYQLTGLSEKQEEFADQVGFIDDKKARRGGLLLMAGSRTKPETVVGRNPQRVLQWQPRNNSLGFDGTQRFCFRSHDFNQDPVTGVEEASRDVFRSGVNFTADGGEWICQRANGFPIFYLSAEGKKERVNNAPADIALEAGGGRVGVAEKCIRCHINGFHGGRLQGTGKGKDGAKPYTDHFDRIPAALGQEFFSRGATYKGNLETSTSFDQGRDYPNAARTASIIQDDALKRAGAYLEDPDWKEEAKANPLIKPRALPVPTELSEEYRKDLTVERQAQELGTSIDTILALEAARGKMTLTQYKTKYPQGTLLSRAEFAQSYCRRVQEVKRFSNVQFAPQQRNPAPPPESHNSQPEEPSTRPFAEPGS